MVDEENNRTFYRSTRLPLVKVQFKQDHINHWITTVALFDSGSTTNLINRKIIIQHRLKTKKGKPVKLNGFQESLKTSAYDEYININVKGQQNSIGYITCLVVNHLNVSLLVGYPCIQHKFDTLELKKEHIIMHGKETVQFTRMIPKNLTIENKILCPGLNSIKISRRWNTDNDHEISFNHENLRLLSENESLGKSNSEVVCNIWNFGDEFIDTRTLENCLQIDEVPKNNNRKPDHYRKTLKLCTLDMSSIDIHNNASKQYRSKLKTLIQKYNHIFCRGDNDLGCYNGPENYTIKLLGPIQETYKTRSFNQKENEFIQKTINELLKNGVIEECSHSRIYTGIVLAKKKPGKDGKPKLRFCIDSTIPNKNTYCAQNFPLPVLDDQLQDMCTARIYSSVDFMSAFWQIMLPEHQKHLYTFSFKNRCYQQRRSSFGTKGMAAYFMSLTANMFRHIEGVSVYMDDVVIHHCDCNNHLKAIEEVFEVISKRNMVLNLEKCSFLYPQHEAYGYIVGNGKFFPNPKRIEKLLDLPFPETLKELQASLGSLNYYRLSIKNYKKYAEPFYDISSKFEFKPELKQQWKELLEAAGKAILRTKPDPNLPIRVITDCSATAGGVVMSQKQDGSEYKPILADSYLLKGRILLSKISMKELYIVYMTLRKYRKMLKVFPKIELITDNRVVFCLISKMSEIGVFSTDAPSRWLCFISNFDIEVKHMKGESPEFALADIMSRNKIYDLKSVRLTIGNLRKDEALTFEDTANVFTDTAAVVDAQTVMRTFNVEKLRDLIKKAQHKYAFESKSKNDNVRTEILQLSNKKQVNVKIYYDKNNKLYVPNEYVDEFLQATHVHNLSTWYNNVLKMKVVFSPLHKTLLNYFQNCVVCQSLNQKHNKFEKTTLQTTFDVGELVYADVVHVMKRKFLAMKDHFSGYTLITEIKTENEKDITDGFIMLMCQLFVPKVIQTDNQKSFTSKKFQDLCQTLNIRLRHSTSRNSRSAGLIERHFRSLRSVLKIMFQSEDDLSIQVSVANFVLNNKKSSGKDLTPYQMLTLRTNNYPVNLPSMSLSRLKTLDPNFTNFHKAAGEIIEETREKQLKQKISKSTTKLYKKGDRILIKAYPTGNHNKTQPFYGREVFIVKKVFPYSKTYEIEKIDQNKSIHRTKFLIHHRLTVKLAEKIKKEQQNEQQKETTSESDGEESMDDIDRFHENDNQNESSDESSQTGELKNTPVRSNNRGGHGYSLRSRN